MATLPDLKNVKPADWTLLVSAALVLLSVTDGIAGFSIAKGQEETSLIMAVVFLLVWVGMRFFPPKPIDRRKETHFSKSHVQTAFIAQIDKKMSFEDAKHLPCMDDKLTKEALQLANKGQRLKQAVNDRDLLLTVEKGVYYVAPIDMTVFQS